MTSKVPEAKPASPRLKTSRFELVSASHGLCDQPQDVRDQANSARGRRWRHFPFNFQDCRAFLQGYASTVVVTQGTPKLQFRPRASSPGLFTRNRMELKTRTIFDPSLLFILEPEYFGHSGVHGFSLFFLSLVHYAQLHQHNNQINLRSFSSALDFGVVAATVFNGMAVSPCSFWLKSDAAHLCQLS